MNARRRAATPPPSDASEVGQVEYLYGVRWGEDLDGYVRPRVVRFRVARKTARRVYFVLGDGPDRGRPVIGYVDRQRLEADGEVYSRSVGGRLARRGPGVGLLLGE